MARQLWLLRHADAEPHGTREDSERRLTERGERQARTAGIALERLGVDFHAVLCSPKVRAQRTAELAVESWPAQQRELLAVHRPLAGAFDAAQALAEMAGAPADGRVLLIGHEPDLSGVVAELCGGRVEMKKAGLAIVRLQGAGGELLALLRPVDLALIAGGVGGVPIHGE
jgi:phosphohistidine phosphatase